MQYNYERSDQTHDVSVLKGRINTSICGFEIQNTKH